MTWRYSAASVAGSSHVAVGAGCQDAHSCAVLPAGDGTPMLVAIVSDGAGSAERGAAGSALVTTNLMEQITAWLGDGGTLEYLEQTKVFEWLDGIREVIAIEAAADNLPMRAYAATLLLAIVDERHAVFAQIGDGAIVTANSSGDWACEFWPRRGTYANQTFFVTDDGAHGNLQFTHSVEPVTELALFSDGLERVLLNIAEQRAHGPAFEKMFRPLRTADGQGHIAPLSEALARYLVEPAIASRTDDDITLVIAARPALQLIEEPPCPSTVKR